MGGAGARVGPAGVEEERPSMTGGTGQVVIFFFFSFLIPLIFSVVKVDLGFSKNYQNLQGAL